MYPADLKYTAAHEWARLEGDIVSVGITAYAVQELGDLTFLEFPELGKPVAAGKPFGVIESVKATSELNAPVSGEVVEVNEGLAEDLDVVKNDPYGAGWMIKIRATDAAADLASLLSAEAYGERVSED